MAVKLYRGTDRLCVQHFAPFVHRALGSGSQDRYLLIMVADLYVADVGTGRRGLLVEVRTSDAKVRDQAIARFESRLFEERIHVGLIVTPRETIVVRDTLSSMKKAKNVFDVHRMPTPRLFGQARIGAVRTGAAFEDQVVRWLESIGESWFDTLPADLVPHFVPDVVGSLAQASIERVAHRNAS